MADLHCPARLTLASDRATVESMTFRTGAVYASAAGAEVVAGLDREHVVLEGPLSVAIEQVADLHRGEDVLVALGAAEMEQLGAPVPGPARLDVDADGWLLRS